tara:strand:+ start:556 stop:882 length:327 start_codon:yes stop_codon:yes gene_type:complete
MSWQDVLKFEPMKGKYEIKQNVYSGRRDLEELREYIPTLTKQIKKIEGNIENPSEYIGQYHNGFTGMIHEIESINKRVHTIKKITKKLDFFLEHLNFYKSTVLEERLQ